MDASVVASPVRDDVADEMQWNHRESIVGRARSRPFFIRPPQPIRKPLLRWASFASRTLAYAMTTARRHDTVTPSPE